MSDKLNTSELTSSGASTKRSTRGSDTRQPVASATRTARVRPSLPAVRPSGAGGPAARRNMTAQSSIVDPAHNGGVQGSGHGVSRAMRSNAPDVVASTFANADLASAKAAVETYYQQYQEAVAENASLQAALQQQEEDSLQMVQFLSNKLKSVEEEANKYRDSINQLLEDHKMAQKVLQEQYSEMIRERDVELATFSTLTTRLQDDLRQASRYVQQRQEHTMELQQLHVELEELAAAHEKDLAALRLQTVDRKLKLIALEKTMRAEFDTLVDAESSRRLEERFHALLERTRTLEEEKLTMTLNMNDLLHLASDIDAERTTIRRKADTQAQAHRELTRYVFARSKQKQRADMKIQQLEAKVRQLTMEQRTVRQDVASVYERRISDLSEQLKATQDSLQSHRIDLHQMRQLTTKVVGQRSSLENFFHTAIADCQRYREGSSTGVRTVGSTIGSRPPVADSIAVGSEMVDWSGTGTGSSGKAATLPTVVTPDGAFFQELPWEDKEKVIKSLFFFINTNYYKGGGGSGRGSGGGNSYVSGDSGSATRSEGVDNSTALPTLIL